MADPAPYQISYSFAGFQANSPSTPLPAVRLDAELQNIRSALDSLVGSVKDVRRPDGALQNGVVNYDSLSTELQTAGMLPLDTWQSGISYGEGRILLNSVDMYRVVASHVSSDFGADLSSGLLEFLVTLPKGDPGELMGGVRYDVAQALDVEKQNQARENIDAARNYKEVGRFHPKEYLSALDWEAAQNFNVTAQNEVAVTAALRAMHDAGLAWVQGGALRAAVFDYGSAGYAISDELFSPNFYAALWSQTGLGATKSLSFKGAADRATKFFVKNWVSPVVTRATGPLAGKVGPSAIFPLHVTGYRCSFMLSDFEIEGSWDITKDPMGIWGYNLLDNEWSNISIEGLSNSGIWLEGAFNSAMSKIKLQTVGLQPLNCGEINGATSGFPSRTVTFTLADNANGTATVTASEDYFLAEHESNSERFVLNGGRFIASTQQPCTFTVTSVLSATQAVMTPTSAVTFHEGAGKIGSFLMLRGAISADSDQLVLDYPLNLGGTEVGRYLMVPKAGSKQHTMLDLLVARITAISPDKKTITLSHQARATVSDQPIVVAPAWFCGRSEDCLAIGGLYANDLTVDNLRCEYSHGYTNAQCSAVMAVWQEVDISDVQTSKTHCANVDRPNFGQGAINTIFDSCTSIELANHHFTHGGWTPDKGNIWIMGERSYINLPNAQLGQWRMHQDEALIYLDPKTSSELKTRVMLSGFAVDTDSSLFPNAAQKLIRLGANGSERMVRAIGPIHSEAAGFETSFMMPPVRQRVAPIPTLLTASHDLNDIKDDGTYYWQALGTTPANMPSNNAQYSTMLVISTASNLGCVQIIFYRDNNSISRRAYFGGSWTTWRTLIIDGDAAINQSVLTSSSPQFVAVGIGGAPDASLLIDAQSTTKGSRPFPTLTTTQRDAISPATGSIIFNSTTGYYEWWSGSVWRRIQENASGNASAANAMFVGTYMQVGATYFYKFNGRAQMRSPGDGQIDVRNAADSAYSKLGAASINNLSLVNAADDTAAASGGVAVGELYRNGSVVMVRAS